MMRKFAGLLLGALLGCGGSASQAANLTQDQLARAAMLQQLPRLGTDVTNGHSADAYCVAEAMRSEPGFDPLAEPSRDSSIVERLRQMDPLFVHASLCVAPHPDVIRTRDGGPAYMLWVDSISAAPPRRIWGTIVVGPQLG